MGISWVSYISFFLLSVALFIETRGAHKEAGREQEERAWVM